MDTDGVRSIPGLDGKSQGFGLVALPDDLWMRILQTGVGSGQLKSRDLCTMAIVSTGLKHDCESDVLWKELVAQEFPESMKVKEPSAADYDSAEAGWKRRYQVRYKKVRARKSAAQRRQVMLVISALRALQQEVRLLTERLAHDRETQRDVQGELRRLRGRLNNSRRSSVALQIWQPQAVSTRHHQLVEQAPIDLEAKIHSLANYERECTLRIQCSENAMRKKAVAIKWKLADLDSLLYTPLTAEKSDHLNSKLSEIWRTEGLDFLNGKNLDSLKSRFAASAIRDYTSKFLRSRGIDLDNLKNDEKSA